MINPSKYILLLFFFCLIEIIGAQIKPCIRLTEDDGLAGNMVWDMIKDEKANLWFATDNGLTRYDGNNFFNFHKNDGLPSNEVRSVAMDKENTIYAACYHSGLAIIKNNSVVKVLHTKGSYPNSFRKLFFSKAINKLLVGTDYGLYILMDTVLVPVSYPKLSNVKSTITSITENESRVFFSAHGTGLFELIYDSAKVYQSKAVKIGTSGRFSCTVLNDTLYSSDYFNIFVNPLKNIANQQKYGEVNKEFFIWKIQPYEGNKFLLGGLGDIRYTGNLLSYNLYEKTYDSLPYNIGAQAVNSIFIDKSNKQTWLGTDNGVVCLFESPFEYYRFKNMDYILDIEYKGDSLFILTKNSLSIYCNNRLTKVLSKNEIFNRSSAEYSKLRSVYHDAIYNNFGMHNALELSNLFSEKGNVYVHTTRGVLSVPDLKTYYPFGLGAIKIIDKNHLYVNILYANLRHYTGQLGPKDYTEPSGKKGFLNTVFKIVESNGIIYFCTYTNGIYALKNNQYYYLDESNSKIDNNLTDIDVDEKGRVWCTSNNGNVFHIAMMDSLVVLKTLNSANSGLNGNSCKWLKFNSGFLFIASNLGLNVISIEKLYSKNPEMEYFFNQYNGYENISAVSPVSDRQGNIYVHTTDGIIKIQSDFLAAKTQTITLQNIIINNNKACIEQISDKQLPYSTSNISFQFILIKMPLAKNMAYRYKVNDDNWNKGNLINLQALRSGKYEILLEVTDKETNSKYTKKIDFSIKKPFWQTVWFVSVFSVLLALVVYIAMKQRIIFLKKQHEEKTRLIIRNSELQLKSLQLQMNPHFIFNALQSVMGYILVKNVEEALVYIGNLADVIRANLENAREDYIHLNTEIAFLKKYAEIEKIRFKDNLNVVFNNKVLHSNIMIPPMLIQPIMENAVKHGVRGLKSNGQITVEFSHYDGTLLVSVEDNGVGRQNTKKEQNGGHKSVGLTIIRQRLELLNEKHHTNIHRIDFIDLLTDGIPSGTRVEIRLKLELS